MKKLTGTKIVKIEEDLFKKVNVVGPFPFGRATFSLQHITIDFLYTVCCIRCKFSVYSSSSNMNEFKYSLIQYAFNTIEVRLHFPVLYFLCLNSYHALMTTDKLSECSPLCLWLCTDGMRELKLSVLGLCLQNIFFNSLFISSFRNA